MVELQSRHNRLFVTDSSHNSTNSRARYNYVRILCQIKNKNVRSDPDQIIVVVVVTLKLSTTSNALLTN